MTGKDSSTPKKVESVLAISHDKDVDGLSAAAIVWRYAKSKELKCDVILTDYGAFEQVFSKVAGRRNTLIIVTDLGLDEFTLEPVIAGLSSAISQGCKVVWLDHHQWSNGAIKSILALGNKPILKVNHDYCAAEIAHKVLMPKDEISRELAHIAHDADFNLREIDVATSLTDALSIIRFGAIDRRQDITDALLPLLRKLAESGVSGLWDSDEGKFKDFLLAQQVHHYRKEKLKKMRKALAGHCEQEIHGRLVRIVEMPNGLTTTDIGTFASDAENLKINSQQLRIADLFITLSQRGMLGFRRGSDTVSCSVVAKMFNGGGHPYAAGGEYGLYDDFESACDDIFVILSKNTDWLVADSNI